MEHWGARLGTARVAGSLWDAAATRGVDIVAGLDVTVGSFRQKLYRGTAMLCAAIVLSACVSTQAGRIGADDGTDSCRPQLVALDSTGNFFAEDILKGAAVGAGAGALGGAAVGGLASGNWRGALIGAAVGAAAGATVGAAAGYYNALQQQGRDQADLFTQVKGDLRNENVQLDRTQLAFDRLRDCRANQARQIQADYRAGRLNRTQAANAMAQVRQRSQRDVQLARSINGQIGGRTGQLAVAAANTTPRAPGEAPPPPMLRPPAIELRAPRPGLAPVRPSLPPDLPLRLAAGELPANAFTAATLRVTGAGPLPTLHLECTDPLLTVKKLSVRPGDQTTTARLRAVGPSDFFLSFEPGSIGQPPCELAARIETADGLSDPHPVGRIVRLPRIEKFSLSSELAAANTYLGWLEGEELEAIERTGWNEETGVAVTSTPLPVSNSGSRQRLRVAMPWPPPAPQSPLYVWLRGESAGRRTTVVY